MKQIWPKESAMRGVGGKFLGVHDTLVDTLGVPGAWRGDYRWFGCQSRRWQYLGGQILAGGVGFTRGARFSKGTAAVGAGVYYATGKSKTEVLRTRQEYSAITRL